MTDADRHHAHGPLQPMAPDAWHDRQCGLGRIPIWFSLGLIAAALGAWVL